MPKVYLMSEVGEYENPWNGAPTYCFVEPVDWSVEFEEWYVDENYALIDNDGCSYRLVWSAAAGFKIIWVAQSDEYKILFYKWLRIWLSGLRPKLYESLRFPPGSLLDGNLTEFINDQSRVRLVADNATGRKRLLPALDGFLSYFRKRK
jgi:hypothetical protein